MGNVVDMHPSHPVMVTHKQVMDTMLAARALGNGSFFTPAAVISILNCYAIAMNALAIGSPEHTKQILGAAEWDRDLEA